MSSTIRQDLLALIHEALAEAERPVEGQIDDDTSLYDALGDDYALVSFDRSIATAAFEDAARKRGFPLNVVVCEKPDSAAWLQTSLILVRPDRHIAWRGDALPEDAESLLDLLTARGEDVV